MQAEVDACYQMALPQSCESAVALPINIHRMGAISEGDDRHEQEGELATRIPPAGAISNDTTCFKT